MKRPAPTVTRGSRGSGAWIVALLLGLAAVLIATGLAPRWQEAFESDGPPSVLEDAEPDAVLEMEAEVSPEPTVKTETGPEPASPEKLEALLVAYNEALGRNDTAGALRHAGAYVAAAPDDAYGYALRGYAHWLRSRCDSAEADMTRAIALADGYGYAFFARASCRFYMGEIGPAERDARDAVAHAANDGEAGYANELAGWIAYGQGKFDEAARAFEAAGQGGDGMAPVGLWLARSRSDPGRDLPLVVPEGAEKEERLVYDVLAGRRDRALLQNAARRGGPAAFYLAQLALLEGRPEEALDLLGRYTSGGFSTDMTFAVARMQKSQLR